VSVSVFCVVSKVYSKFLFFVFCGAANLPKENLQKFVVNLGYYGPGFRGWGWGWG